MSGVWGGSGDGRQALEGEISPTLDAQYAGSHRKNLGLSGFLRVREDCDTMGNMRGKTDRSSPPFSTLSTLVLPTL